MTAGCAGNTDAAGDGDEADARETGDVEPGESSPQEAETGATGSLEAETGLAKAGDYAPGPVEATAGPSDGTGRSGEADTRPGEAAVIGPGKARVEPGEAGAHEPSEASIGPGETGAHEAASTDEAVAGWRVPPGMHGTCTYRS